jgi:hypothetical protein
LQNVILDGEITVVNYSKTISILSISLSFTVILPEKWSAGKNFNMSKYGDDIKKKKFILKKEFRKFH